MPLASYIAPKKKIEFDGGDIDIRAISLNDVAIILDSHQYAIDRIASMIREKGIGDQQVIVDLIVEVIRESPLLATNIIALCADEVEFQEAAMRLPLPVQVEILQAIGDITFKDEAAVKKFGADVMRLIRGIIPTAMEAAAKAA